MNNILDGIILSIVAGVINGSFATPTKYTSRWRWENIWAVWAVVALFLFPWFLGFATVPRLLDFYRDTSAGFIIMLIALGLGVGLSQVFFGLALAAVGLSIGFAVTIGLSTAIGSFVPLITLQSAAVFTLKGLAILAGIALVVIGTAICSVASNMKEKGRVRPAASSTIEAAPRRFGKGLILCILAGVLSPLANFALAYGAPLLHRASQLGVSPANQANVIWPPLLTATMLPYLAYCAHLWRKNRSWRLYALPDTKLYWVFGAIMGSLWTGSLALYGAASTRLAAMGPIVGWPLFMSVIIITSNAWGFITGEWKGVSRRAVATMLGGIAFLILGFCMVASGSWLP